MVGVVVVTTERATLSFFSHINITGISMKQIMLLALCGMTLCLNVALGQMICPVQSSRSNSRATDSLPATGLLSGRVVDDENNPLLRASVKLVGNRGCYTTSDGAFLLSGIPAGSYDVVIKFAGKEDYTATVEIVANRTTVVEDIVMKSLKGLNIRGCCFCDCPRQIIRDGSVTIITGDEINGPAPRSSRYVTHRLTPISHRAQEIESVESTATEVPNEKSEQTPSPEHLDEASQGDASETLTPDIR